MKPYDEKKVTYANLLYKRLKEIDEKNNIDALMGIMEEANDKLQIHIVSKEEIENLKRKCNPKNYMKPYNSQKVDFANRLYSRLNNKKITDKDYFEIYKESQQLVNVN